MKKEIEQKCLYAMQLAMRINPEYVDWSEQDGRPAVGVEFSGVTCSLNVYIYPDGFDFGKELESMTYRYGDNGDEEEVLDGIIAKLEEFYREWGVKDE